MHVFCHSISAVNKSGTLIPDLNWTCLNSSPIFIRGKHCTVFLLQPGQAGMQNKWPVSLGHTSVANVAFFCWRKKINPSILFCYLKLSEYIFTVYSSLLREDFSVIVLIFNFLLCFCMLLCHCIYSTALSKNLLCRGQNYFQKLQFF